ncbi:MAG: tetratricopeptide repeat protein [Chloroflexi bacterium AL-W]|nr:tetratricopeptide repeat protein [Chloroflexi bacterium AL-N1]NOK66965.1 tetratricopeptide repeat protein [Chloroflexi bacterium AL-N10]NOK74743.1 tetratricopeptide repeat protein [Chloroflexi bacterium AL-N5]NOK81567.1 tetratricopeptide repeat protein [Chloroflexi bacterium AL-W]NOK89037.1 tetratricopeptide repeat protein [Chloroflexi bacterium AL-N15]
MPGNRALYDRAMEQSREAARQKQWEEALKQAVRALQEFPQDTDARTSVAVTLFNTGKYPQALQIFEELIVNNNSNPFVLEYIARIYEQMGDMSAAIASYTQLADLQQNRRLPAKAIEALREVLRLNAEATEQHERVAQLFEQLGDTGKASTEYLTLALQLQAQGELTQAVTYAESALRLDPNSREIKELIGSLHAGLAENTPGATDEAHPTTGALPTSGMTGELRSQQFAIEKIIVLAQEHQEAGDFLGAISQYERAIAMGMERNDVFYSLGLLYQETDNHQKAVQALVRAASDPEYALSAHYALGTSYYTLKQLPQAAQEYEQTIRLVDLQTIGKAEADDLIHMYESAAGVYTELNDIARAASLYSTLAGFLQSKRWGRERAEEFRKKAKELTERNMFAKLRTLGTGALTMPEPPPPETTPTETMPETWGKIRPITDFLKADRAAESSSADIFATTTDVIAEKPIDPLAVLDTLPTPEQNAFAPITQLDTTGLDEVSMRYVHASEKYVEQKLTIAALDACLEVIRIKPDYLPIHLRMGEIYEREGHPDQALTKYQLLIDTYIARNEPNLAIDVYYRLIELSPDTVNARSRLADLLKEDNRPKEAAEQLAFVASSYFRMGQTNKALEEYRRGLQWSPDSKTLHAQYGHALLKLERYEAALGEFRRALELDQQDLAGIARINATLAIMREQSTAIWQSLATLLDQLKNQPQQHPDVQSEYRTTLMIADEPILHYILGIVQQSAGQHQSALLEFEQAVELLHQDEDPLLPTVLVHQAMADSYIALGQADAALEQLQKGQAVTQQELPPIPPESRFPFSTPLTQGELVRRMAEAYGASGDLEGAERALQQAKKHLPYDRAIYTKLADIYFRQGKLNEALAQLEELATNYENRQDLDRAIESLEYGLKLAPSNISIGKRLAQLCLRRGYLDRGVEGLKTVAEQQRRAGQIKEAVASLQQAAEVHWTLGQQEQARGIYDQIVKIAPNDVEARQWLSFMYTLAGRTDEAIAEKKQIVRISLQQRDYEGATAELFTIIALDQADTDAYYTLGDVLMRREEYEQAARIYGRLANMPNIETERVEALQLAAKRMLEQQQVRSESS